MDQKDKENRRAIFIFFIFFGGIILLLRVWGYYKDKDLDENKVTSIGKFSYCKRYDKTKPAVMVYYIDRKKYKEECGTCPDNYQAMLKKFYVIHYSSLHPENVRVDFTKQVTDTVVLRREGFS